MPFDAEGKPGEMIAIRFTYDPDGTIAPEVLEFSISPYSVDPYSTMVWKIRTRNAASVRYIMMDKDVLDYYEENYPLDQILGIGSKLTRITLPQVKDRTGLPFIIRDFRKVEPIESSLRLPTGTETRSMSRIQPFWHHMRTSSKP